MGLLKTFVSRPVTTTMMVLVFVVLGLVSYQRMVVDLFPELEFPLVQIIAEYPGAGPDEIESQIVKKIEDEVSNISDIKEITSRIFEGYAWTVIEFELGVDADLKALDVKDKIELIKRDLPDAAEDPIVAKFDPLSIPVLQVALSSDFMSGRDLYELADKNLKNLFGQIPGVAKVELTGGAKRQINIWTRLDKLAHYGLTINTMLQILGAENLDIPAGNIRQKTREIGIRFKGEAKSVEELANLTFNVDDKGVIKLSDVARIEDGSEEISSLVRFNESEAVLLKIFKRADGNTIEVADKAYAKIDEVRENHLPENVSIAIAFDQSDFIRDSVRNARDNIVMGVILCAILLFVFLQNVRITFVAVVVLPTSIVSAFMLMEFGGFTINVLTLLALGISIGALVANAIVVLENISRYLERGEKPKNAAVMGTKEVAVAVIAAAGTNIVVFTPIAFMGGIIGQFFFQFGLTVVFATMFSLLASFSLTPMLSGVLIKHKTADRQESSFMKVIKSPLTAFSSLIKGMEVIYGDYLKGALRHPFFVILFTIAFFIGSFYLFPFIGGEFFPASDQSMVQIVVQLPKGSTDAAAAETIKQIEKVIKEEIPEMKSYTATAGGESAGFDEINIIVNLVKPEKRERADRDIFYDIQPSLARIAGGEMIVLGDTTGGSRADIDVDLYGPDYETLARLSREMRQKIMDTGNFRAVFNKYRDPKDEIHFIPDQHRRATYEVPNVLMGLLMRYSIEGEEGSVLRMGGEEYKVKIRLEESDRNSFEDLKTYRIPTSEGFVPLNQLGDFKRTKGISDINRKNKRRVITLECFIAEKSLTENVALIDEKFKEMSLPEGYTYVFAGQAEMQQESSQSIMTAFVLAIVLTYMLLAAILNSFLHPLTIMITIPLGMIGVIFTLFFTGITMNMMSMMAIVMLVGIVVNNAILVIDYALQKINTCQESLEDCVLDASLVKFRAILMTNLAIIAGIFPQVLGGSGTEFMVPMAAATIGGVAVSTLFTFFTIPALFLVIEKMNQKVQSWFR